MTSTDVVNQALLYMGGNQPPVTGAAPTFDTSTCGVAAAALYAPCVQTVARQFGWDFARSTATLALSGNAAPVPWSLEYLYPTSGIQVWQLVPAVLIDPNDPLPVNFVVANALVTGVRTKVIHTDLANALAVFNNAPGENLWDAEFREAVARLLASEMAEAVAGKPDAAEALLQSGGAFETLGEGRRN